MIRVAQITDTHYMPRAHEPNHGMDTDASLARVLDLVLQYDPNLVLVTGDLSESGDESSYRRLKTHLEALDRPVHVIPGNHDDAAALNRVLPGGRIRSDSLVDLEDWYLILVDTSTPGQPHGELGPDRLRSLADDLDACRGQPCGLFMHHPPANVGSDWLDRMGLLEPGELGNRLTGHDVRFIAAGHVHQAHERALGGIPVYTAPSTGAQARPGTDRFIHDELGAGFRWFELDAGGRFSTGVERIDDDYRAFMVG